MGRPAGSKNKATKETPMDGEATGVTDDALLFPTIPFTGIARSMECVIHNGFNNFYLVTLAMKDGRVVSRTVSDPYASFEAIARMEIEIHKAALNLNTGYANGKAWQC